MSKGNDSFDVDNLNQKKIVQDVEYLLELEVRRCSYNSIGKWRLSSLSYVMYHLGDTRFITYLTIKLTTAGSSGAQHEKLYCTVQ